MNIIENRVKQIIELISSEYDITCNITYNKICYVDDYYIVYYDIECGGFSKSSTVILIDSDITNLQYLYNDFNDIMQDFIVSCYKVIKDE